MFRENNCDKIQNLVPIFFWAQWTGRITEPKNGSIHQWLKENSVGEYGFTDRMDHDWGIQSSFEGKIDGEIP